MKGRNYTNFEAMMVIYLPVKYDSIGQSTFELESENRNVDGQTNKRNYTNFKSNLAMIVIYLPVKFAFDWTKGFHVTVRKQKC